MPQTEAENRRIAGEVEKIHMESPDKGYRRIRDDLQRYHGIDVNDKRVLRICRKLGIKSTETIEKIRSSGAKGSCY